MIVEKVQIAKALEDYYKKNIFRELKKNAEKITRELTNDIDLLASDYNLVLKNSVHDSIQLFDVVYRVKEPKSFYNKLIDKDTNYPFGLEKLCNKNSYVDKFIYEYKDLIGIKIVTNLHEDCKSVLELLKKRNFSSKISIDFTGKIPDEMLNGLTIYKMPAKYNNQHFELQIKSKLDSAWGDLEHLLFYKDYDFYHLKKNNRLLMADIGVVLRNVENMLLKIRCAKSDFRNDYEMISFHNQMNDNYGEDFTCIFGNTKLLEECITILFDIKTVAIKEGFFGASDYGKRKKIEIESINSNFNPYVNFILTMKNANVRLATLFFVYLNWHTETELSSNFENTVLKFVEHLTSVQFKNVGKILGKEIIIKEEMLKFTKVMEKYCTMGISNDLLINLSNIELLYLMNSSVQEEIYDSELSYYSFEEDDKFNVLQELYEIIFNQIFIKDFNIRGFKLNYRRDDYIGIIYKAKKRCIYGLEKTFIDNDMIEKYSLLINKVFI